MSPNNKNWAVKRPGDANDNLTWYRLIFQGFLFEALEKELLEGTTSIAMFTICFTCTFVPFHYIKHSESNSVIKSSIFLF